MARSRKLYYNIDLSGPNASETVALTQVTAGTPGDRNGSHLEPLPALNGNAPEKQRQRQELTAIYVPYAMSVGMTVTQILCAFLANGTDLAPYYTAGGTGTTPVANKAGSSAVFVTHPRVRVSHGAGVEAEATIRGTLYVQRQHSLEV